MTRPKFNIAKICKLLQIYADDIYIDKKTEILESTFVANDSDQTL